MGRAANGVEGEVRAMHALGGGEEGRAAIAGRVVRSRGMVNQ